MQYADRLIPLISVEYYTVAMCVFQLFHVTPLRSSVAVPSGPSDTGASWTGTPLITAVMPPPSFSAVALRSTSAVQTDRHTDSDSYKWGRVGVSGSVHLPHCQVRDPSEWPPGAAFWMLGIRYARAKKSISSMGGPLLSLRGPLQGVRRLLPILKERDPPEMVLCLRRRTLCLRGPSQCLEGTWKVHSRARTAAYKLGMSLPSLRAERDHSMYEQTISGMARQLPCLRGFNQHIPMCWLKWAPLGAHFKSESFSMLNARSGLQKDSFPVVDWGLSVRESSRTELGPLWSVLLSLGTKMLRARLVLLRSPSFHTLLSISCC